jgi:cytochrome c1
MTEVEQVVGAVLVVVSCGALLAAFAKNAELERVERAWRCAVAALGAEHIEGLKMPKVIFEKPPQGLARRGGEVYGAYNPYTNTVTATADEALVHEFCHAVLFQTEGLAAMRDEARVRAQCGGGETDDRG